MDVKRDEDKEEGGDKCESRSAGTDLEADIPNTLSARERRLRRKNSAAVPKLSSDISKPSTGPSSSSSSLSSNARFDCVLPLSPGVDAGREDEYISPREDDIVTGSTNESSSPARNASSSASSCLLRSSLLNEEAVRGG